MRCPRLARRVRLLALSVAGIGLLAACVPIAPPPPPPPDPPYQTQYCSGGLPVRAADYQAQHDGIRTVNTDFAAGDHGMPVDLQDGRILWLFADTWIGFIRNNAMVAPYSNVHNAFIVQSGGCLRPLLGGTHGARTALITGTGGEYFWPMDAYVDGSRLYVFLANLAPGTGICGCIALNVKIAQFALPSLQLVSVRPGPASTSLPEWGGATYSDGTYEYFAGRNSVDAQHPQWHHLARVRHGDDPGDPSVWRYWNGGTAGDDSDWGTLGADVPCGSGGPCPMKFEMPGAGLTAVGPNAPISVIPQPGGGYLAAAKLRDVLPDPIYTWRSPTPWGPWTAPTFAASTPPVGDGFTYGGRIFQLPGGEPTASYNTAGSNTDLFTDRYQVLFRTPAPCSVAVVPCIP